MTTPAGVAHAVSRSAFFSARPPERLSSKPAGWRGSLYPSSRGTLRRQADTFGRRAGVPGTRNSRAAPRDVTDARRPSVAPALGRSGAASAAETDISWSPNKLPLLKSSRQARHLGSPKLRHSVLWVWHVCGPATFTRNGWAWRISAAQRKTQWGHLIW
ncbi:PREDICTED: uncharacterized protein LOC109383009 isoform X2 [Hipposideros armiger]|uniref:Uncharacterized protein LOC109383009 isoform X2 n=1 Tax=Hipposideros armiger TaxID=186990 RepID=A0A8B7RGE7_HIPAR|nr:PREDICTED: uncharacterized protein LOC109383009 isoform X2 [Hipposideros armiger]